MAGVSRVDKQIAVLDANIYISATFWDGNPYHIVKKAIDQKFIAFISDDILKEIRRALSRDFLLEKPEIEDIADSIVLFTNLIIPKEKVSVVKDDPDDDRILECALACNAKYIVTQDNHLLKLKEFKGIKILNPEEFWNMIR